MSRASPVETQVKTSAVPSSRSIILGLAGHIDHGKTSLIHALTGTDTDRLPEEKRRGITIDIGFAALQLQTQQGPLHVSLIDVPGHHAFVRNMLAGAGGIEAVLMVVAADEGVMAQTREHLDICSLLGVRHGLVLLTKCDLVDEQRLRSVQSSITEELGATFLRSSPVLPVSARTGYGLSHLRQALAQLAATLPRPQSGLVLRLPPDRAFSMRGFGTVVTGTLQSGTIASGGQLVLEPGGRRVRVRGIQVHGHPVESASGPSRVALNLTSLQPAEVVRGDALTVENPATAVRVIDVELSLLPGTGALHHRSRVRLHAFAGDVGATLLLYAPAGSAAAEDIAPLARLQLDRPQLLFPGDRFVLRRPSPAITIGGGRILDTLCPPRVKRRDTTVWLDAVRKTDLSGQLRMRVARRGAQGATLDDLGAETGLISATMLPTLMELCSQQRLRGYGAPPHRCFVTAASLEQVEHALLHSLAESPSHCFSQAELRSRVCTATRASTWVCEFALDSLATSKRILIEDGIRLPGGSAAAQHQDAEAIERELLAAGIAPPLLKDAAARAGVAAPQLRTAVTQLLRAKRLLRLGSDDLFIHAAAVQALTKRLRAHRGESFDVPRFKQFTGLTRKHAIPLLELLDRERVTRNQGGIRIVL